MFTHKVNTRKQEIKISIKIRYQHEYFRRFVSQRSKIILIAGKIKIRLIETTRIEINRILKKSWIIKTNWTLKFISWKGKIVTVKIKRRIRKTYTRSLIKIKIKIGTIIGSLKVEVRVRGKSLVRIIKTIGRWSWCYWNSWGLLKS